MTGAGGWRTIADVVRRWMAYEGRRNAVATIVALLLAPAIFLVEPPGDDRLTNTLLYLLAYWILWCVCQIVATWLIFGRWPAHEFSARIRESQPKRRTFWQVVSGEDDGAVSLGTVLCVVMVALTLYVFLTPSLRANTAIVTLAACTVVSSWLLNTFAYTIEYARTDQRKPGLVFPGSERPAFSDYLYHAMTVNATFSTSDVTVTSREMRRLTTTHTLIAFGFNTVIFALLITLLTTAGR